MEIQDEEALHNLLEDIHSQAEEDLAAEFGDVQELSENEAEALALGTS